MLQRRGRTSLPSRLEAFLLEKGSTIKKVKKKKKEFLAKKPSEPKESLTSTKPVLLAEPKDEIYL